MILVMHFVFSNVPFDQTFVFSFKERNTICETQKPKLCTYHSLVGIEISLCSTQIIYCIINFAESDVLQRPPGEFTQMLMNYH